MNLAWSIRLSVVISLLMALPLDIYAAPKRPNIILMLVDDLGYDDLGVYGNPEIRTPNIDAFASEGMRLTNFYTAGAVCSPTRASILTGRYPLNFGLKRIYDGEDLRGIPPSVRTLPETLKKAGYYPLHIGKWHLGESQKYFRPIGFGFAESLLWYRGLGDHNNFSLSLNDGAPQSYTGAYMMHELTDYFVDFVASYDKEKPFFVYFAPYSVHAPIVVPNGFDNTNFGYNLTRSRDRFSAMVSDVDLQFKRILDALDARGIADNTLVLFTGDNGAFKAVKSETSALRGNKSEMYEGGIKVPLIARWPGKVPVGKVNDSVALSIDLYPTIAEIAKQDTSALNLPGKSLLKILTKNAAQKRSEKLFWTISNATSFSATRSGTNDDFAVRKGRYKLVRQDNVTALYDLIADPGEQTDVSTAHQDIVTDLTKALTNWRLKTARIDYKTKLTGNRVELAKLGSGGTVYDFKGKTGRVRVNNNQINHIGDGDFTFSTRFRASSVSGTRVIAHHKGFILKIVDGVLIADFFNNADQQLTLTGGTIQKGKSYNVAFTIYGWRDSNNTFRLYLNKQLVAESTDDLDLVTDSDDLLAIGGPLTGKSISSNDKLQSFKGWIAPPKVWALSLEASEL